MSHLMPAKRPMITQNDVVKRSSLRGLKKCTSCGHLNGQRAQICRNLDCDIRKDALAAQRPYDPVQLETHNSTTAIYSLRSKERESQPRNFVAFDNLMSLSVEHHTAILTCKAVCYMEACRQENRKHKVMSNCKHIKACKNNSIPQAEVFPVTHAALDALNISDNQKKLLWAMCNEDESMPAVQRLNANTFVVKCAQSEVFPVGGLHVTALSNGLSTKKGCYACACKKLKIIVEPDNSLVMQEEICDHLLLVLAAVLSHRNGKAIFGNFLNSLNSYWNKEPTASVDNILSAPDDTLMGMNVSSGGSIDQVMSDDFLICLFGNEYLAQDQLPGFAEDDTIASIKSSNLTNSPAPNMLYAGDPNLVSSCDIYDEDSNMRFDGVGNMNERIEATHVQLTDCNIELMDQFQLTDQIDLCSEDIAFPIESEAINIFAPSVYTESITVAEPRSTMPLVRTNTANQQLSAAARTQMTSGNSVALPLPPIELPTIAVVKKAEIKPSGITTELKIRKQPHVPAKRTVIGNHASTNNSTDAATDGVALASSGPALPYTAWLEYVIETINASVVPADVDLKHMNSNFHVHKPMFAHFCKSFSAGMKRRTPNEVAAIKQGKFKGLTKYTWHFNSAPAVKRIFATQNVTLHTERAFERNADGDYVPYEQQPPVAGCQIDAKKRRIYPKLSLFIAQILLSCASDKEKHGLLLHWIPDVLPISQFGLLSIEFTLQTRVPKCY